MGQSELRMIYANLAKIHRDRMTEGSLEFDDTLFLINKEMLFGHYGIREDRANNNLLFALLESECPFEEFLDVFGCASQMAA